MLIAFKSVCCINDCFLFLFLLFFACCWHTWNRPTWQPIADIVRFAVCFMQNIQRKYVNMLALWNKLVAKIDVRPNIYSDVNFWIIRYLLMHISCIRWNDADCDKVKNQSHIVAAAKCSQAIHSINILTFFPFILIRSFGCVYVCIFC